VNILERQLELEAGANDYSYDRLIKSINKRLKAKQADELAEGRYILIHAIDLVAAKIVDYFEQDIRGTQKRARDLIALDFYEKPKDLAYIILATIVRSISKDVMVKAVSLISLLNSSLYDSIMIRRLEKSDTTYGSFVDKRYSNRSVAFRQNTKINIMRKQEQLNHPQLNDLTTYLGGVLLDLVIKSGCNIIESKKIFSKKKTSSFIVYTEECYRMVLQSRERLLLDYRKFPILLAKPLDWTGLHGSGGYYRPEIYDVPLIKMKHSNKGLLDRYFKTADCSGLYRTLNTLQGTAWRINRRVYDVLDYVFTNNFVDPECVSNNPYLIGKLAYNGRQEPEDYVNVHDYGEVQTEGQYRGLPVDHSEMCSYLRAIDKQEDLILANLGKAVMLNLILFNAKEYLEEEEFYFSYQYDFRGRIYPIQQHLQPQSKGEVKSLLEFKNGSRIEDDEQLFWFLVHGANCYGFDKEEYDVRVSKIIDLTDDIKEIADNPIQNRNLWKDADDPYLFLAWCFEYADYLKDPENFISHIPIALDATCSGIQIYSGLLRDAQGARAVNVIGNTRNDIYREVADKVNEYLRAGDYEKLVTYKTSDGLTREESTVAIADSFKGKVTRKLTKRNTMTQPYSVTRYGMYQQVLAELRELEAHNKKFWVGETWVAAKVLTALNDRAIAETVKGARAGQIFLKEVTADVVKRGEWVFYTTPVTNFPVLQKIHKTTLDRITTPIGKLTIRTTTDELNPQKMVSGIAPNFIHSLDAALLAMTVDKLEQDGCKDYHLIHDSYGVPINQVVNLNKRIRESYIELFKKEPLQQFIKQVNPSFEERAAEVMINTLDIGEVMNSKYIFS
jgi:DNA-directed RNA polymerase